MPRIRDYHNRKAYYDRNWLELYAALPDDWRAWVDERVKLISRDNKGHHYKIDQYQKAIDGLGRRGAQELVVKTLIYLVREIL